MMRSLFSGVSGLRNHQTRMDVIGNNIANVNTTGFKASSVNFEDMLSQTIQGASSPQNGLGGTNPMQVGLGVTLASISTNFTDGSTESTGVDTDLAISGNGFFVLAPNSKNTDNLVYTRAGNFDFDKQGNYVVPGTGYNVMGWMGNNGVINSSGDVMGINIPVGLQMACNKTTTVTYEHNLDSNGALVPTPATAPTSITVYDGQGNPHILNGTLTKTAPNTWSFTTPATDNTGATVALTATTVTFSAGGVYTGGTATVVITPASPIGASPFTVTLDFTKLTQYNDGEGSTVKATDQDGYAAGTLASTTMDTSGVITGKFTNGQSQKLAQVALAVFNNPGGLLKLGDTTYAESNNSGQKQIGPSNSGGRGAIAPGSLEMSNVDLAQEFSDMIITQRGFQANSKIITTSDDMLQILADLKR